VTHELTKEVNDVRDNDIYKTPIVHEYSNATVQHWEWIRQMSWLWISRL